MQTVGGYYRKDGAYKFLVSKGFPIARSTWNRISCPGSGNAPRPARYLKLKASSKRGHPLYTEEALLDWAMNVLTRPAEDPAQAA